MTASTVLRELQALGVEVLAQGSNLLIRPASKVPPELEAKLRERKPEILAVLSGRFDCMEIPGADLPERAQCPACRGRLWWRSLHGVLICAQCHAPASPAVVKSWWWGNIPEAKQ
jgi:hypothetical protein